MEGNKEMREERDMKKEGEVMDSAPMQYSNFIQDIIHKDHEENTFGGSVHTRFPPEPNGYLHIGHAKSICLNSALAIQNKGKFNLRFDDTNPSKEETEYVESIIEDVKWLGADFEDRLFYASDYFQKLYDFAIALIKVGKAYVCDLTAQEIKDYRGTLTEHGINSPYRERSIEESLSLFEGMKEGKFADESRVLRAKIDMASPNINMRDPVMYRISRSVHHRTGSGWIIYPMYDYAHPIEDYLEGITHSICTLEFEAHRPLYEWFLTNLNLKNPPKQIEFARLNLNYTVMSKRKLLKLVKESHVKGWDDPRMPTISGLRRRGYTPYAIRDFCARIGVAKAESTVDVALLEHCVREDLNATSDRMMAVLRPLKVVILNYPDDQVEYFEGEVGPNDEAGRTRKIPFSREIFIEEEDFMEEPPPKYFRLFPGNEVRLKFAYIIKCEQVIKDPNTGRIIEVHCTYDEHSRGGNATDGRKIKGTLHWVCAKNAVEAEVRLYNNLFTVPNPDTEEEGKTFLDYLNPDSVEILKGCKLEPALLNATSEKRYQFLRMGYFYKDKDATNECLVFNRTVTLKDTWAKISK
jgi:glutaminyl-tRNA synthetase